MTPGVSPPVSLDPPEERQDVVLGATDYLVGDGAVRRLVHGRKPITRPGCPRQKCLALIGIERVGEETDPELGPHLEVGQMRLCDLFGRDSGTSWRSMNSGIGVLLRQTSS